MAKEKKKPNTYVLKKTHDTQVGVMKHEIKRIEDGIVANFTTGKADNTVIDVNVGGDKVIYADGMIANSVALKNGNTVIYDTDFNGNQTTTVMDEKGNDITNTAAGKQAARDALKAILKADGVVAEISKSRDNWKNLPNFKGLYSWANKAQAQFVARQKIAEARQKLLDVQSKGYANAEIAINSGASPEEVAKARKKDEKVAADKATARAKANIKIRDEQRAEERATKLKVHEAAQKAFREREF